VARFADGVYSEAADCKFQEHPPRAKRSPRQASQASQRTENNTNSHPIGTLFLLPRSAATPAMVKEPVPHTGFRFRLLANQHKRLLIGSTSMPMSDGIVARL